jgi:hypothetical protein
LLARLEIMLHRLYCFRCDEKFRQLESAREFMRTGFFPSTPDFEDSVMRLIRKESVLDEAPESAMGGFSIIQGLSLRGWVITGFVVLLSLGSAFFGMGFTKVAADEGSSFLVPIGLTMGMVVTGYGALFIASHLKELSERFGLH